MGAADACSTYRSPLDTDKIAWNSRIFHDREFGTLLTRPSRMFIWPIAAWVLCTIAVSAGAARVAEPRARSVWDGVYTEAQAAKGHVLYETHCADCHGSDLNGIEQASALAGGTFNDAWNGATLKKLFERIETMPPNQQKSLPAQEYTDILAYILNASEFPAGTVSLAADRALLAEITYHSVRPKP